jgi:hypothetical protein
MIIILIIGNRFGGNFVKFIHCFSPELKNKLIQNGFKLVSENNNLFIFENNVKLTFDFNKLDRNQFMFSNTLFI